MRRRHSMTNCGRMVRDSAVELSEPITPYTTFSSFKMGGGSQKHALWCRISNGHISATVRSTSCFVLASVGFSGSADRITLYFRSKFTAASRGFPAIARLSCLTTKIFINNVRLLRRRDVAKCTTFVTSCFHAAKNYYRGWICIDLYSADIDLVGTC